MHAIIWLPFMLFWETCSTLFPLFRGRHVMKHNQITLLMHLHIQQVDSCTNSPCVRSFVPSNKMAPIRSAVLNCFTKLLKKSSGLKGCNLRALPMLSMKFCCSYLDLCHFHGCKLFCTHGGTGIDIPRRLVVVSCMRGIMSGYIVVWALL